MECFRPASLELYLARYIYCEIYMYDEVMMIYNQNTNLKKSFHSAG